MGGILRFKVAWNNGVCVSRALEILHGTLVLFRRGARLEGAQIAPLAGLGIGLARIEPVLSGWQLADHGSVSSYAFSTAIEAKVFQT
jgi:hypothetical protein